MPKHAVWHILTLRCEEASRLASKTLDGPVSRSDRVALRVHLWLCAACRRFLHQIRQLREVTDQCATHDVSDGPPLPADVRDRIRQALNEERS